MRTAMVTGASRGVGRGIAASLAQSGYRVFGTGRGVAAADLPPAVERVVCDHLCDEQTAAAFECLGGLLDILVNSAWGGYERMVENGVYTWQLPFWYQPAHRWSGMMDAGVRAAYVCASHAARIMAPRGQGLIVNIGYWAARKYMGNVIYGMAKAATDKMTADMAHELCPHGVAVVSLYPGLVRTEAVMAASAGGRLDISNSESAEFQGLAIAALAQDPDLIRRSGSVVVSAELALEYGLRETDGRRPAALTLETA